jgi:penicillin-binding protein 1A
MNTVARKLVSLGCAFAALSVTVVAVFVGAYFYVEPSLPEASELRNIEIQIPLTVYSRDGRLMAQFGEQKRTPIDFEQIPKLIVNAFLAAEDDTFFEHPGIDYTGIARAAVNLAVNYLISDDDRVPGASTITQQVAREFLLTKDYSLVRKFREQIMAVRIEHEFTKEEILELFLNTTFLGQRSYGVVAAARSYFDKNLDDLTLAEAALIAGIPQGPSVLNPVSNPEAARTRRSYVLRRMLDLGMITRQEHDAAASVPVLPTLYGAKIELNAPYVAEMVRAEMVRRYGLAAYTAGLKVTTTIDSRLQAISNAAIHDALVAYDRRHGFRGPLAHVELGDVTDPEALRDILTDYPPLREYESGLVVAVTPEEASVYTPYRGFVTVGFDAVSWARPYISDDEQGPAPKTVPDVLAPGDIIRIRATETGTMELAQIPDVQGALVSLDPNDGAIAALNGGFDFNLDNFNRATQARRQPGSAFKPFTFSAALENGFTVASIVTDSPLTLAGTEQEQAWRPRNSGNKWYGDVSLREVLEKSINVAAVKVVQQAGVGNVVEHVRRFGFSTVATPRSLAIALGAGGVAPVELATGYSAFANGGYRIEPYFVQRIEDGAGFVLYEAKPLFACAECEEMPLAEGDLDPRDAELVDATELYPDVRRAERIISPQNAYLIVDMMQGVIRHGTGRRARALERSDLAGKTGTTNEDRDTWFAGFNADLVAVTWVGFNEDRPLGRGEEGARTALPMWISYMGEALAQSPLHLRPEPTGIVEVRINPDNGLRASPRNPHVVTEKFMIGHVPEREPDTFAQPELAGDGPGSTSQRPGGGEPIF